MAASLGLGQRSKLKYDFELNRGTQIEVLQNLFIMKTRLIFENSRNLSILEPSSNFESVRKNQRPYMLPHNGHGHWVNYTFSESLCSDKHVGDGIHFNLIGAIWFLYILFSRHFELGRHLESGQISWWPINVFLRVILQDHKSDALHELDEMAFFSGFIRVFVFFPHHIMQSQ